MRRVDMDSTGSEIVFNKYPAKAYPCDPDEGYLFQKSQEALRANSTKFTCLDTSEIFFQGTLVSPVHSYMHFELLACE